MVSGKLHRGYDRMEDLFGSDWAVRSGRLC